MRIVVGLGNPGRVYAATRHNVGFMVVDELARRWHLSFGSARPSARLAQGDIAGEYTMVVEPQLYMNRSGAALSDVLVEISASDLIVVHDDLDLECGCVRVKRDGGTAGHRGMDSVAACYGPAFTRVRVGIGHPVHGEDVAAYVLAPFAGEQQEAATAAVQRAADAVEYVLREGEVKAMNCFNVRTKSGAAAAPAPMGRN